MEWGASPGDKVPCSVEACLGYFRLNFNKQEEHYQAICACNVTGLMVLVLATE